ncbi:hypothetical protein BT96DRAFT_934420 [Gymnopus androsaceus JB14]|uniref:Uncharacterized protein n=1 Tax=Gymnopus androsaceus JB14 TaxID=1447944 RepID=A0A6A4IBK5_9AGAR|nr:hypothetical protein BT96DRAFT_934420 [Gymnopus androsaceus JB14]
MRTVEDACSLRWLFCSTAHLFCKNEALAKYHIEFKTAQSLASAFYSIFKKDKLLYGELDIVSCRLCCWPFNQSVILQILSRSEVVKGYYKSGIDFMIGYCDVKPSSKGLEVQSGGGFSWQVIIDLDLSSVSNSGVLVVTIMHESSFWHKNTKKNKENERNTG